MNIRLILLLLLSLVLLLAVHLIGRDAFFRVEARTERLEIVIRPSGASERANLAWEVPGDSIFINGQIDTFTGYVVPAAGARVVLRRAGSGPLIVEIDPPSDTAVAALSDTAVAAILHAPDDDPVDTARGRFELKAQPATDRSYTFPYFGAAGVGEVVRSSGSELLLDGSASILGSTVWRGNRFVAGTIPLRMGDDVRITAASRCSDDAASASAPGVFGVGVARVGGEPGIAVVHEARGQALRISRAGAQTHCFRASLWSFLSADPLVGGLLVFAAGVLIAVVQSLITLALTPAPGPSVHDERPGGRP